MKFEVDKKIFERFPDLKIGIVIANDINNQSPQKEIAQLLNDIERKIFSDYSGKIVSEHPTIAKWREAYKIFGCKDLRSSIESLIKRASKGQGLPNINKLVDIYNYISLKYILPVGGEDLDKVEGDILLTEASGKERFIPLLETENNPPKSNEIIYKDDKEVICRAWNWREADKIKLTENTKNAVFVVESLLDEENNRLQKAVDELKTLLVKYCEAKCESSVLSIKNRVTILKIES